MAKADNTNTVLYHYLQILSAKVSRNTVDRLLDNPTGGSMRGISDALDALHVNNQVYQLPSHDYFSQLEAPFITLFEIEQDSFCVVTRKDDFVVEYFNGDGRKYRTNINTFLQHWSGTVLLSEITNETLKEKHLLFKRILYVLLQYKLFFTIIFSLVLGLQILSHQSQPPPFIAYVTTLSIGILVSVAILYKE